MRGLSVHTGSAKNTMVNAANVAMEFHLSLPHMARPRPPKAGKASTTCARMTGDVTEAKLGYILRDHDAAKLEYKKDNLLQTAAWFNGKYGPGTVTVELKDGYRNMIEKIRPHFTWWRLPAPPSAPPGWSRRKCPSGAAPTAPSSAGRACPAPTWAPAASTSTACWSASPPSGWDKATEVILNIVGLYARDPA